MFEILYWIVAVTLTIVAASAFKQFVVFAVTSVLRPTRKNYNTVTK